jgi:2-phospho-L-lactate guanylyltransferase
MGIGAPGQSDLGTSMLNLVDASSTRPDRENGRVPWTVVIPLKPPGVGKSRLGSDPALAQAIALDTVEAASRAYQVSRVVVVTADEGLAGEVMALHGDGEVIIEPEPRGIASAIASGLEHIPKDWKRAALLGDLPGLLPEDLDVALNLATDVDRAFVRDAEGTGTTLVTARRGISFEEHFGPGSAEAHIAAEFDELAIPAQSSLRYDIDDPEQLEALAVRWLGPRTRAHLDGSGTP